MMNISPGRLINDYDVPGMNKLLSADSRQEKKTHPYGRLAGLSSLMFCSGH
jgi:hypothetical protein